MRRQFRKNQISFSLLFPHGFSFQSHHGGNQAGQAAAMWYQHHHASVEANFEPGESGPEFKELRGEIFFRFLN